MDAGHDRIAAEEAVLYRTRLHWAMLLAPALIMFLAGLSIPSKGMHAIILLAIATLWGVIWTINVRISEITLTKNRVLARVGFPWKRSYNIPFEDIVGVDIYQPLLGKLVDFGRVTFFLKNKKNKSLRMVLSPHTFVRQFSELKQASIDREGQEQ